MWYTKTIEEVKKSFKTNQERGLTEEEVKIRQIEFGKNRLAEKKKESFFIRFLKQFQDFMILILIAASVVSAVVSYFQGENDYFDSIIIIAIVVFNAIMGLVQEAKAEKSLKALKKMAAPMAKVRRNGTIQMIKGEDLVPGDIMILEAGNYVPADCRLLQIFDLKIEESSLTGETVPVTKSVEILSNPNLSIGDITNMAFASTMVVNGHGEAIVTETGMETKVGKIAKMMIEDKAPETPIQKKLGEVGKILGWACLAICAFIFLIGIFKKIPIMEMFMTSVGLAVAAIPEGLPAIVTIMLSIGVTKMAKRNSIIRKLPAVETLGSSRVICSDKTGTLTQNKMQVVKIANSNAIIDLKETQNEEKKILQFGSLCTECDIVEKEGKWQAEGEPTEVAIVNGALQCGIDKRKEEKEYPLFYEIPFDSGRKRMSTIHKLENGHYLIIVKGAPDVLLTRCEYYAKESQIRELNFEQREKIQQMNEKMAQEALRVLAVAFAEVEILPQKIEAEEIEKKLVFLGLIGMIDPPREGVKEAVTTCRRAGIKTVMITGDHIATATAIAKELGILKGQDKAITGNELDKIPETELRRNIMQYSVFARVSPEHKVRIVKAFQSTGAVVAMTGDGVNDAPALKNADIGIAMGIGGTDVAKNASDMILADDNFVTIVEAVKQGRSIFENIKKAVHFLIATNIGEIVTIFLGLLLGLKSPLLAIQLLWVNLVTDSLPAIALGLQPPEQDIMKHKPRDSKKSLFADGLWGKIFIEGMMIGGLTILAFSIGNYYYGLEVGRTMAFISIGILELVHSFNIKSEHSLLKVGIKDNLYLVGAFILGVFLQVIVVCIPMVASLFDVVMLTPVQWIIVIIISICPLFIIELQKKMNEIKFGKTIYQYQEKKIEQSEN